MTTPSDVNRFALILGAPVAAVALAATPVLAQETPAAAPAAPAAPSPSATPSWFDAIAAHAFVSFAYTFNFDRPDSNLNALRVFDVGHDSFTLDVAELTLVHPASNAGEVGFRVDLEAGQTIPPISSALGLFKHVDAMGVVSAEDFDLQQAFVSWVAPVGNGLRIDVGKWLSPMTAEVVEGWDGYGDNYSHSWLFGYAVPYSHTGLRLGYSATPEVSLSAALVNGWDNATDNNHGKTWIVGATYAVPTFTLALTYAGGPEQNGNDDHLRHVLDAVAVVRAGKATVTAEGDFGVEANVANGGADTAAWYGGAAYLKLELTGDLALTGRVEYFADPDGARTGTAQDLVGVTLTPAYKIASAVIVRADLRLDHSDERVFFEHDDPSSDQVTLGLNVLAAY